MAATLLRTRATTSFLSHNVALLAFALFLVGCAAQKPTAKAPSTPAPDVTYIEKKAERTPERREAIADVEYMPVKGITQKQISNNFGAPRDGGARSHKGIDIFAPSGRELLAVTSGYVSRSYNNLGGNSVYLRGDNGLTYYYAHLSRYHANANDGDRVQGGQVVGYVGNSGNAKNTPPHLHFEIRKNGQTINPYYALTDPDMIVTPIGASAPVEYADYRTPPNSTERTVTRPSPARNTGGEARRSTSSESVSKSSNSRVASRTVAKAKSKSSTKKLAAKPSKKEKQLAAKVNKGKKKQAKKYAVKKKASSPKKKYADKRGRGHGSRG